MRKLIKEDSRAAPFSGTMENQPLCFYGGEREIEREKEREREL